MPDQEFYTWHRNQFQNGQLPEGTPLVRVQYQPGSYLYPNAARVVERDFQKDQVFDPPANALKRLTLQKQYYGSRLSVARTAFNALKAALLGHGQWNWGTHENKQFDLPPTESSEALKRLQEIVKSYHKLIKKIDSEIATLPETIQAKEHAKQREQQQVQAASLEQKRRESIQKIQI